MEILQTKLAGGLSVIHVIVIAAVLLLGYVGMKTMMKKPVAADTLRAKMSCGVCGWTGMVSKHKSKCSSCGSTTLTAAR